jgi:hypothetical protein
MLFRSIVVLVATVAGAAPPTVVPVTQLRFVETKATYDTPQGDGQDSMRFVTIVGELKNESPYTVEAIVADIAYVDASGNVLGLDSIGTAVKRDLSDESPGERFSGEVSFVPPKGTSPVKHLRNLGAIKGKVAGYRLAFRPATVVSSAPQVVAKRTADFVKTVDNEYLPGESLHEQRVQSFTVTNSQAAPCVRPAVVVGFLKDGKLLEFSSQDVMPDVMGVLGSGATATIRHYTLVGFEHGWKKKAPTKVWVQCAVE